MARRWLSAKLVHMSMPPEVAEAVRYLDSRSASWTEVEQQEWRKVRGFVRSRRRESQQQLASVATVAQEIVQVRDHAHAALAAMEGVFGTGEHDKLPGDE